jgi:hypothetical protein
MDAALDARIAAAMEALGCRPGHCPHASGGERRHVSLCGPPKHPDPRRADDRLAPTSLAENSLELLGDAARDP